MEIAEVTIRILNYDDVINDCQIILEACDLLSIPQYIEEAWLTEYLLNNVTVEV